MAQRCYGWRRQPRDERDWRFTVPRRLTNLGLSRVHGPGVTREGVTSLEPPGPLTRMP